MQLTLFLIFLFKTPPRINLSKFKLNVMQFSHKPKRKVLINITSLIDVMFILLIFVMVTSTFLEQPGIKLELPKVKSVEIEQVENLVIYIDEKQELFLNDHQSTLRDLKERLQDAIKGNPNPTLVLRADRTVPHGLVVKVMDIAKQSGIKRLVVATRLEMAE